jgi:hypothetical protein
MYYKFNKETLDFERTKITNKSLTGLGAAVGLLLIFGFTSNPNNKVENLSQEEKLIVVREYREFSEEKLIEKITELNFKYPHIILAQAKLESGHFKSTIFLENNNMFGMKEAKLRANLAKGTNRGHAYYETWQESVIDYAYVLSSMTINPSTHPRKHSQPIPFGTLANVIATCALWTVLPRF